MKSSTIPVTCGVAIAAMCAAGLSHWWSVRELVALTANGSKHPPAGIASLHTTPVEPAGSPAPAPVRSTPSPEPAAPAETAISQPASADQQKFFEALVTRIENLQNQNRDLLDQLAETNRDLMKLEFRVDSHSASFRPLPVTEEQPFTSLDTDIGVLPPRATPIMMDQE